LAGEINRGIDYAAANVRFHLGPKRFNHGKLETIKRVRFSRTIYQIWERWKRPCCGLGSRNPVVSVQP
jgi:hypothetical protein